MTDLTIEGTWQFIIVGGGADIGVINFSLIMYNIKIKPNFQIVHMD